MTWLALAIAAHFLNAIVFTIDKSVLSGSSRLSHPLRYTFWSGLLAGGTGVILPFVYTPLTSFIITWSLVAGLTHLAALWFFFVGLQKGESSRVVPIAGSAVPLFTLIIAVTTLGETLQMRQLVGVLLLIVGGVLLSIKLSKTGLSSTTIVATVTSGLFFAVHFAVMKYLYDLADTTFLSVFAYSRIIESLCALVIVGPFMYWRVPPTRTVPKKVKSHLVTSAFLGSKVLAAIAFILQSYAIAAGSVTIVNALQGTQYLFLLLLAAIISWRLPQLFKEEWQRVALLQKVGGVICVCIGLFFLL